MDIVDEINSEFEGPVAEFLNTEDDNSPVKEYDIGVFPTNIFFDENGAEYHRQIKAMSKEDVLFWLGKGSTDEN